MNTEMTKAILDGRKVQTRRVIKVDTVHWDSPTLLEPDSCVKFNFSAGGCQNYSPTPHFENSKYKIGETIWVREPAKIIGHIYENNSSLKVDIEFAYVADGKKSKVILPNRFYDENMCVPKWVTHRQGIPNGCIKEMVRIFLKITDVRVERLQDISRASIKNEGCPIDYIKCEDYQDEMINWWIKFWNKTAQKGYKWEDNPYVFVYEYERV